MARCAEAAPKELGDHGGGGDEGGEGEGRGVAERGDVELEADPDQEERHQELGDSVGQVADASLGGFGKRHAGEEGADDRGYAGVDREQGEREQERHGERELGFAKSHVGVHPGHDAADGTGPEVGDEGSEGRWRSRW